jgi:glucose/arabinose dehydrogenase
MGQLDDDAAVHPTGDGTYTTRLSSAWNIGATPNGGYAMSSALRALVDVTGRPDPVSVTVHYLRPATPDADGTNSVDYVFTYGHRNPFGGDWKKVVGRLERMVCDPSSTTVA